MIILGVDPGTASTGYGLIEIKSGLRPIEHGLIQTFPHEELSERLRRIYQSIKDIVEKYEPEEIAVEEIFFLSQRQKRYFCRASTGSYCASSLLE